MLRTNVILVLRGSIPAVVRCQLLSTVALDRASGEALETSSYFDVTRTMVLEMDAAKLG